MGFAFSVDLGALFYLEPLAECHSRHQDPSRGLGRTGPEHSHSVATDSSENSLGGVDIWIFV